MSGTEVQVRTGRLSVRPDGVRVHRTPVGALRGTVRWLRETDGSAVGVMGASTATSALAGATSQLPALVSWLTDGSGAPSLGPGVALAALALLPLAAIGLRTAVDDAVALDEVDRVEATADDDGPELTLVRPDDADGWHGIGGGDRTYRPVSEAALADATRALRRRGVTVEEVDGDA